MLSVVQIRAEMIETIDGNIQGTLNEVGTAVSLHDRTLNAIKACPINDSNVWITDTLTTQLFSRKQSHFPHLTRARDKNSIPVLFLSRRERAVLEISMPVPEI